MRNSTKDGLPASMLGKFKTFFFFISVITFFTPLKISLLNNLALIFFCANVLGLNQNEISLRTFDYQKLDPKSRKGFPIRLNHYQTDISKIKRDLEWEPTFDLLNGLRDSFAKDFINKKSEEFDENSDHILFNS